MQAGIPCGPHCKCNNCHNGKGEDCLTAAALEARAAKGVDQAKEAPAAAATAVVMDPAALPPVKAEPISYQQPVPAPPPHAYPAMQPLDGATRKTSPATPNVK